MFIQQDLSRSLTINTAKFLFIDVYLIGGGTRLARSCGSVTNRGTGHSVLGRIEGSRGKYAFSLDRAIARLHNTHSFSHYRLGPNQGGSGSITESR
jgi:hypothetical protein